MKKILRISSAEGLASTSVPVAIISPRRVLRSMTINAPVRSLESMAQLSQMALMQRIILLLFSKLFPPMLFTVFRICVSEKLVRPSFSSIFRSSGWKMISNAKTP